MVCLDVIILASNELDTSVQESWKQVTRRCLEKMVESPGQLNLTVTLASIPDVPGGKRVIPITADSDTRFTEILQNLTDQGVIKPADDQHEYVFKRVASNQIINNPNTSLQQAGVKEGEDLKLFVQERWA